MLNWQENSVNSSEDTVFHQHILRFKLRDGVEQIVWKYFSTRHDARGRWRTKKEPSDSDFREDVLLTMHCDHKQGFDPGQPVICKWTMMHWFSENVFWMLGPRLIFRSQIHQSLAVAHCIFALSCLCIILSISGRHSLQKDIHFPWGLTIQHLRLDYVCGAEQHSPFWPRGWTHRFPFESLTVEFQIQPTIWHSDVWLTDSNCDNLVTPICKNLSLHIN